jgi:hypothetical protein
MLLTPLEWQFTAKHGLEVWQELLFPSHRVEAAAVAAKVLLKQTYRPDTVHSDASTS